jgi:hypothetical protein
LSRKWDTCCKYNYDLKAGKIDIKWFLEGETNVCYNALDRCAARIRESARRHILLSVGFK